MPNASSRCDRILALIDSCLEETAAVIDDDEAPVAAVPIRSTHEGGPRHEHHRTGMGEASRSTPPRAALEGGHAGDRQVGDGHAAHPAGRGLRRSRETGVLTLVPHKD